MLSRLGIDIIHLLKIKIFLSELDSFVVLCGIAAAIFSTCFYAMLYYLIVIKIH